MSAQSTALGDAALDGTSNDGSGQDLYDGSPGDAADSQFDDGTSDDYWDDNLTDLLDSSDSEGSLSNVSGQLDDEDSTDYSDEYDANVADDKAELGLSDSQAPDNSNIFDASLPESDIQTFSRQQKSVQSDGADDASNADINQGVTASADEGPRENFTSKPANLFFETYQSMFADDVVYGILNVSQDFVSETVKAVNGMLQKSGGDYYDLTGLSQLNDSTANVDSLRRVRRLRHRLSRRQALFRPSMSFASERQSLLGGTATDSVRQSSSVFSNMKKWISSHRFTGSQGSRDMSGRSARDSSPAGVTQQQGPELFGASKMSGIRPKPRPPQSSNSMQPQYGKGDSNEEASRKRDRETRNMGSTLLTEEVTLSDGTKKLIKLPMSKRISNYVAKNPVKVILSVLGASFFVSVLAAVVSTTRGHGGISNTSLPLNGSVIASLNSQLLTQTAAHLSNSSVINDSAALVSSWTNFLAEFEPNASGFCNFFKNTAGVSDVLRQDIEASGLFSEYTTEMQNLMLLVTTAQSTTLKQEFPKLSIDSLSSNLFQDLNSTLSYRNVTDKISRRAVKFSTEYFCNLAKSINA